MQNSSIFMEIATHLAAVVAGVLGAVARRGGRFDRGFRRFRFLEPRDWPPDVCIDLV